MSSRFWYFPNNNNFARQFQWIFDHHPKLPQIKMAVTSIIHLIMLLHNPVLLSHGIHFQKSLWRWRKHLDHWVIILSKDGNEQKNCNRTFILHFTQNNAQVLTNQKLKRYTHFLGHNCSLKVFTNCTALKPPSYFSHQLSTRNWLFWKSKIQAHGFPISS